jgi:hypothetical protein
MPANGKMGFNWAFEGLITWVTIFWNVTPCMLSDTFQLFGGIGCHLPCRRRNQVSPKRWTFNPPNAELNPTCHLLALLGAHPILHVSRIKSNYRTEKKLRPRKQMS